MDCGAVIQRIARAASFFLIPLLRLYWYFARPKTIGVKVLIVRGGRVILVRHNYGKTDHWTVPGGKVKKGEPPEAAAKREMHEELGISIQNLRQIGVYYTEHEYKMDTVLYFSATADTDGIKKDDYEILEASWFSLDDLPNPRTPSVERGMEMYRRAA